MKLTRNNLRKFILREMGELPELPRGPDALNDQIGDKLAQWLGERRALQLWFHGAHHMVKGPTFSGDHAKLYDRIYTEIQDSFDADVEKAVGVSGDQSVACPKRHLDIAIQHLSDVQSPAALDAESLADEAMMLVQSHLAMLEEMFETLESQGKLSLGLNDHLAAQANQVESYVYLLGQRTS